MFSSFRTTRNMRWTSLLIVTFSCGIAHAQQWTKVNFNVRFEARQIAVHGRTIAVLAQDTGVSSAAKWYVMLSKNAGATFEVYDSSSAFRTGADMLALLDEETLLVGDVRSEGIVRNGWTEYTSFRTSRVRDDWKQAMYDGYPQMDAVRSLQRLRTGVIGVGDSAWEKGTREIGPTEFEPYSKIYMPTCVLYSADGVSWQFKKSPRIRYGYGFANKDIGIVNDERTTDGGETWTKFELPLGAWEYYQPVASTPTHSYITTPEGLFRADWSLGSWTKVLDHEVYVAHSIGDSTVLVSGYRGQTDHSSALITHDAGSTWTAFRYPGQISYVTSGLNGNVVIATDEGMYLSSDLLSVDRVSRAHNTGMELAGRILRVHDALEQPYQIYDIKGSVIRQGELTSEIALYDLPTGLYFLHSKDIRMSLLLR